jgi:hypothetical protein
MALSSSLLSLARLMALAPADAVALPAVIANAARKVGMAEAALVIECRANVALRDYLAGACRTAMAEVMA